MTRRAWLVALPALCLAVAGCRDVPKTKKPDPTKGAVTGIVICSDTGKPARFANVVLSAYPKKDDKPGDDTALPETETAATGLDGRFRFEAVEPGRYFAFAMLEGYLDPKMGIDLSRPGEKATGQERILDAIDQWKDHLTEVTVGVHTTSEIALQVERGAEIAGSVIYDDGTPAIGVWPDLFRKNAKGGWVAAGSPKMYPLSSSTDGHGRYRITDLRPGEYVVCTALPAASSDMAASICLGNVFRKKEAKPVKVEAGEALEGVDIVVPTTGLRTVAGRVTVAPDAHVPDHATIRLLYADDREIVHETDDLDEDGFSFPFIPEGKYILQVVDANDKEKSVLKTNAEGVDAWVPVPNSARHYADKEIPITVQEGMEDFRITLALAAPAPQAPPAPPPTP